MEDLSPYEKLRLENIERNRLFLVGIGLNPLHSLKIQTTDLRTTNKKRFLKADEATEVDCLRRKSSRLAALDLVSYDETGKVNLDGPIAKKELSTDEVVLPPRQVDCATVDRKPPSLDSTRALDAMFDVFLGPNLSKELASHGKAHVVAIANGGCPPRFNKYSGVTEWANGLFLWVNVGMDNEGGGYHNTFLDGGQTIVWFGGSAMKAASPVIQRLLQLKDPAHAPSSSADKGDEGTGARERGDKGEDEKGDEDGDKDKDEDEGGEHGTILLFMRVGASSPYTCCGRLSLIQHNLRHHPLVFHFALLDHHEIVNGPHHQQFQRILDATPKT